jgi:hypothetical protein
LQTLEFLKRYDSSINSKFTADSPKLLLNVSSK